MIRQRKEIAVGPLIVRRAAGSQELGGAKEGTAYLHILCFRPSELLKNLSRLDSGAPCAMLQTIQNSLAAAGAAELMSLSLFWPIA